MITQESRLAPISSGNTEDHAAAGIDGPQLLCCGFCVKDFGTRYFIWSLEEFYKADVISIIIIMIILRIEKLIFERKN